MLNVMDAFAESEGSLARERRRVGIKHAKDEGRLKRPRISVDG